ncbi:MAG: zinc ribbon domain-containing protein [Clostridia bacterium]|nr:zinc ribbon domain-containing protein [Clostridia bacterium]
MKYCTHCGNEILDEAVVCVKCGCSVNPGGTPGAATPDLVQQLSTRVKVNGIIWMVIGILQIILGLTINWILLIIGALNIVSSVQDIQYSKSVLDEPFGIVEKFKPLTQPIIVLAYNLIFGGVIGVAGSIYYLVGVRNFVLSNESAFAD